MKLKPNPLNYFKLRRLEYPGPHLEYLDIHPNYNLEKALANWILTHCKSRFYIGKSIQIQQSNTLEHRLRIGFEDPKELSYFALACPLLKYK
jgi:hypothetical protein